MLDSLVYLDRTYYQFKTKIDFPCLHIDCDSAEEEELEDTLPYEEPPPPYHSVRTTAVNTTTQAEQQGILQVLADRQASQNQQSQLQNQNILQLDGPLEGTKQYISAATSPSQWREYPLNSVGSQVANWDSTGDYLSQTQSSVGDIQHRNIDYHQHNALICEDGKHCTNPPTLTQPINGLTPTEIKDLHTDDDTKSYDTIDTHIRPEDDFFYCRYAQNLNHLQVGAIAHNTLCFGVQADDTNRNLYAGNNRGAGHRAA